MSAGALAARVRPGTGTDVGPGPSVHGGAGEPFPPRRRRRVSAKPCVARERVGAAAVSGRPRRPAAEEVALPARDERRRGNGGGETVRCGREGAAAS